MIENVHVLQAEALQALVEAGEDVFARAPVAVRTVPHCVAGFRRNDEFVAMRGEVVPEETAKVISAEPGGGP